MTDTTTCSICGEGLSLRDCKVDEQGHATHEECLVRRTQAEADPKEGAIQRLKDKANRLREDQLRALKSATYLGSTREQRQTSEARRQQINDLNMKVDKLHQEQSGSSTLTPNQRERVQELAVQMRDEHDEKRFEQLVSELNDLLAE